MNIENVYIRVASTGDAEEILKIYAPYVQETAITFEYDIPDLTEFRSRIEKTLEKYPYIVALKSGEILGYAYTGAFIARRAYDWAVETSIYIKKGKKGMGIGKTLYKALEDISKAQHITNMNACIAYPEAEDEYLSKNSAEFHEHLGYAMAGKFHKCGYKFGRWYNMIWMEKIIGVHSESPAPVIPFPELGADVLKILGIRQ